MRTTSVVLLVIVSTFFLLTSCSSSDNYLRIKKVGMLIEDNVEDSLWDEKGSEALQKIGNEFDVTVHLKENIKTKHEMIQAIDELVKNDVNLIFGHSDTYGRVFVDISSDYPEVEFIYLNGNYLSQNVTSIIFNSHAIGFFNGMIASKMSANNKVGIIAAYAWQTEIDGFFEGVKYENNQTEVQVNFIKHWNKNDVTLSVYEKMKKSGVDVFYSISDMYNLNIAEKVRKDDLYLLGYIYPHSLNNKNVLANTTQNIDQIYLDIAKKFNDNSLEGGFLTFSFKDGAIYLNEFSNEIPKAYRKLIKRHITTYKKEGLLPYELKIVK